MMQEEPNYSEEQLKRHWRGHRHESESKIYICSECGYQVRVDATFDIYEENDHVRVTTAVECDDCGNMMEE